MALLKVVKIPFRIVGLAISKSVSTSSSVFRLFGGMLSSSTSTVRSKRSGRELAGFMPLRPIHLLNAKMISSSSVYNSLFVKPSPVTALQRVSASQFEILEMLS